VHETQHGKLNALTWLDPVLVNGHSEWTRSPVRPDLRPLMGVLLALHAFVPVAALHKRLADRQHPISQTEPFARRRREVLATNAESLSIVRSLGKTTRLGDKLIAELAALHAACEIA
jgi:HEXXH motif-containing protein